MKGSKRISGEEYVFKLWNKRNFSGIFGEIRMENRKKVNLHFIRWFNSLGSITVCRSMCSRYVRFFLILLIGSKELLQVIDLFVLIV